LLPIVDKEHEIMWCPYCPDKQPVYVYREPDLIAPLAEKFKKNYTLLEMCKQCKSVWLWFPDTKNPGHGFFDTYMKGAGIFVPGVVAGSGLRTVVGLADIKEGHSYIIDSKEAAKGHLVVNENLGRTNQSGHVSIGVDRPENQPEGRRKGRFWNKLRAS
jgi:hypothetical protein